MMRPLSALRLVVQRGKLLPVLMNSRRLVIIHVRIDLVVLIILSSLLRRVPLLVTGLLLLLLLVLLGVHIVFRDVPLLLSTRCARVVGSSSWHLATAVGAARVLRYYEAAVDVVLDCVLDRDLDSGVVLLLLLVTTTHRAGARLLVVASSSVVAHVGSVVWVLVVVRRRRLLDLGLRLAVVVSLGFVRSSSLLPRAMPCRVGGLAVSLREGLVDSDEFVDELLGPCRASAVNGLLEHLFDLLDDLLGDLVLSEVLFVILDELLQLLHLLTRYLLVVVIGEVGPAGSHQRLTHGMLLRALVLLRIDPVRWLVPVVGIGRLVVSSEVRNVRMTCLVVGPA
mmetsp:Transcript_41281/g.62850  ORF Transcript_41281/g.62850 Transcript_41281/m.62850 type:complete len:338 (-) Transcript_41281:1168-2181(-)